MFADFADRRAVAAVADFVANEFKDQFLPPSELFHFHFTTEGVFIHECEGLSVTRPGRRRFLDDNCLGEYPKSNIRLFRVKSVCTVIFMAGHQPGTNGYWRSSADKSLMGGDFLILCLEFRLICFQTINGIPLPISPALPGLRARGKLEHGPFGDFFWRLGAMRQRIICSVLFLTLVSLVPLVDGAEKEDAAADKGKAKAALATITLDESYPEGPGQP